MSQLPSICYTRWYWYWCYPHLITQYIYLRVLATWLAHSMLISLSPYSFSKCRSSTLFIQSHWAFHFWLHQHPSLVLVVLQVHFCLISVLSIYFILFLNINACLHLLCTLWTYHLEQSHSKVSSSQSPQTFTQSVQMRSLSTKFRYNLTIGFS